MKPALQAADRAVLRGALRRASRIAVVAVGSRLRGDDAAGLLTLRALRAAMRGKRCARIRLFAGETAPENITGPILRCRPSHVLLLDAADLGSRPGAAKLIAPDRAEGFSFSSHLLPLGLLAKYLANAPSGSEARRRILVLGIQPDTTAFGRAPAPAIRRAAGLLAAEILRAAAGPETGRRGRRKGPGNGR